MLENKMNLTKFSRNRMMLSATRWSVAREYFDPLYNYLVHGFEPGSFWTAVLANDFMGAVQRSHPSNDIPALKHVVGWIQDSFPLESYGNYHMVRGWANLEPIDRRLILESACMIYTEQEEIMMGLKGVQPVPEPMMW
jgi:hypothetical protein